VPQLPSGQKVGLANYCIIGMGENPFDYLEDIVKIGQIADVYRFIPIIQHVETDESDFEQGTFDKRSTNTHQLDGLKPVVMDYTVQDVLDQLADWSQQDIEAFQTWLNSWPALDMLNEKFIRIVEQKASIDDMVGALAFTDLGPNQDEDEKYRRAASYIKVVRMLPARKD
jgi:hypothetical protein